MTNWAEKHKNIYGYIDENAYLAVNYELIVKSEETFSLVGRLKACKNLNLPAHNEIVWD